MKYLIALLIIIFVASLGMSAVLIIITTFLNWGLQSCNTALIESEEEVIICHNLETVKENQEKQIKYQEQLDPIDIYNEEELNEFYIIPTTEEAYIEPPKVEKICISWKYYAWGNDVCQEWAYSL